MATSALSGWRHGKYPPTKSETSGVARDLLFALLRVPAMKALLACALGLLLISSAPGGDAKKDLDKMQGKWLAELDGKKVAMDFAKDKFTNTLSDGDKEGIFKGAVQIHPSPT